MDNILQNFENKMGNITNSIDNVTNTISNITNSIDNVTNTISNVAVTVYEKSTIINIILVAILVIVIIFILYRLIMKQFGSNWYLNSGRTEPVFICEPCSDKICKIDGNVGYHYGNKAYNYNPKGLLGSHANPIPSDVLNIDKSTYNFTISYWIFLDSRKWLKYIGQWKNIMFRSPSSDPKNSVFGFWATPNKNNIWCVTHTDYRQEGIMIRNIDMDKWLNITMTVTNSNMEIYINGKLLETISLFGSIKNNKGNMYICPNGGFPGFLAYVQYFNKNISAKRIYKLYRYYYKKIQLCDMYPPGKDPDPYPNKCTCIYPDIEPETKETKENSLKKCVYH